MIRSPIFRPILGVVWICCPVRPRCLESEQQLVLRKGGESAGRERRSGDVSTQPLQSVLVAGRDPRRSVKRESSRGVTQLSRLHGLGRIRQHPPHSKPRPIAGGHQPLHRRRGHPGKDRRFIDQRVQGVSVEDAAFFEQMDHAMCRCLDDGPDIGVGQRGRDVKFRLFFDIPVHAVQSERVKMWILI